MGPTDVRRSDSNAAIGSGSTSAATGSGSTSATTGSGSTSATTGSARLRQPPARLGLDLGNQLGLGLDFGNHRLGLDLGSDRLGIDLGNDGGDLDVVGAVGLPGQDPERRSLGNHQFGLGLDLGHDGLPSASATTGSGSTSATGSGSTSATGSGSASATTGSGSGSTSTSATTGSGSTSATSSARPRPRQPPARLLVELDARGVIDEAIVGKHAVGRRSHCVGCGEHLGRRPRLDALRLVRSWRGRKVGRRPCLEADARLDGIGRHDLGGPDHRRSRHRIGDVVDARHREACPASASIVVPAVQAGVLAAVDAEVERLVERLELSRGERSLLGAHGVVEGVREGVLAGQVVLQPTDHPARLAQRVEAGRRLELVARPASFAEGLCEGVSQWLQVLPQIAVARSGPRSIPRETPRATSADRVPRSGRSYPAC